MTVGPGFYNQAQMIVESNINFFIEDMLHHQHYLFPPSKLLSSDPKDGLADPPPRGFPLLATLPAEKGLFLD